ncbi:transposase [Streptomyces kronopolitis]|uniref:transposase n=1 Tax=Streptomyces kronopolitis TaxID=1612435 RepID=UPI0037B21311
MDEFALRKGHNYVTTLLNIETRQPVDLLPDRTVSTVARWLADHPGIDLICRDRSAAYSEAGRLGASDAVHVADRWHIWMNLAEAVEKTVVQHRAVLREQQQKDAVTPLASAVLESTDLEPPSPGGPRTSGRLADRVREQHAAVHVLLDERLSLRPIPPFPAGPRHRPPPRAGGHADELLVGRWSGRTSILEPHKPYLHQR